MLIPPQAMAHLMTGLLESAKTAAFIVSKASLLVPASMPFAVYFIVGRAATPTGMFSAQLSPKKALPSIVAVPTVLSKMTYSVSDAGSSMAKSLFFEASAQLDFNVKDPVQTTDFGLVRLSVRSFWTVSTW
jgi:hypothetical protein